MSTHARPARLDGLYAARGLAVVFMLVAHLSPVGGILDVSEYLTAPLFAVIIGISMGVRLTERRPAPGWFVLDNAQRGLVLIVLGVLLQAIYAQIDVVLPYLGVLIIVLAPLALLLYRVPVLTVGLAGALAVVGPIVVERAREAYPSMADSWPGWSLDLVTWLATGEHYRLVSFLPIPPGRPGPRHGAATGRRPAGRVRRRRRAAPARSRGLRPRSGHDRRLGRLLGHDGRGGGRDVRGQRDGRRASFLRGAPAARVRVRKRAPKPLVATGRLALTAYTVQILWLALLAALRATTPWGDERRGPQRLQPPWLVIGLCPGCSTGAGAPALLKWAMHQLRPQPPPSGLHVYRHAGSSREDSPRAPNRTRRVPYSRRGSGSRVSARSAACR